MRKMDGVPSFPELSVSRARDKVKEKCPLKHHSWHRTVTGRGWLLMDSSM